MSHKPIAKSQSAPCIRNGNGQMRTESLNTCTQQLENHEASTRHEDFPEKLQLEFMLNIVMKLISHPCSAPFRDPVDILADPYYFDIIEYPVDLNMIKQKLECQFYSSPQDCQNDLQKIFYNCALYYTQDHEMFKKMLILRDVFLNILKGIHCVVHDFVNLLVNVEERPDMIQRCDQKSNDSTITLIVRDIASRDKPLQSDVMIIEEETLLMEKNRHKDTENKTISEDSGEDPDESPVTLIVRDGSDKITNSSPESYTASNNLKHQENNSLQLDASELPDNKLATEHVGKRKPRFTQHVMNDVQALPSRGRRRVERFDEKCIRSFQCAMCSETFCTKADLKCHMKTHCVEKDVGVKKEKKQVSVKKEKKDVREKKDYKCKICGDTFPCKTKLGEHMKSIHQPVRSKLLALHCYVCSKDFIRRDVFKLHIHKHDREELKKATPVELFNGIFQQELKNVRSYKCEACDKVFRMKSHLDDHRKTIHMQYRPHICVECGEVFAKLYNLKRHSRIHSGVKEYKCSICESAFHQKSHLSHHIKSIHEKDKNFLEKSSE